jgi:hypothetical protein
MLQRDHVVSLKEKLVMAFWETIIKENKGMPIEEDINSAEVSTEDSIS